MNRCAAYRADTENKRVESKQKMVLLNQALKRYKTLDVMGELGDEDDGERFSLLNSPSHQLLIHLRHRSKVSPKTSKRIYDDLYPELSRSRSNKHEISPMPLNPRNRNTLQKPSFTSKSKIHHEHELTHLEPIVGTKISKFTLTKRTKLK